MALRDRTSLRKRKSDIVVANTPANDLTPKSNGTMHVAHRLVLLNPLSHADQ